MSKIKLTLNSLAIGLIIVGTNAHAQTITTSTTNTGNVSGTNGTDGINASSGVPATSGSNGSDGYYVDIGSSIPTLTNSGTINGGNGGNGGHGFAVGVQPNGGNGGNSGSGIYNKGTISTLVNTGNINAFNGGNGGLPAGGGTRGVDGSSGYGIYIHSSGAIGSFSNLGNITAPVGLQNLGNITTLINDGLISGIGGPGYSGIYSNGVIENLNNNSTITSSNYAGLYLDSLSQTETIANNGLISGTVGLATGGLISTLNNYGTISGISSQAIEMGMDAHIVSLNNYGTISGPNAIVTEGTIESLTNLGSIYCTSTCDAAIGNYLSGSIGTLNNLQGQSNPNGPLTIYSNLPSNYNIIINSATNYGQMSVSSPSGSTAFGIHNTSVITSKLYTGVLQGLTTSNIGGPRTGTYDGMTWTLTLQSGSSTVWDLIFFGATAADTQSSVHALASKLRGAFSGQTMVTNFANMNTYDCNLFDAKGLCVSVGGQQTYVDSPSANMTSAVVVAGYKVSPTLRVGGFLNQNVNSNTGSNVDISNNSPLMGLFAVWNQNENHLGYQVKIANAYQDMDITTTRDVIGTSEAGRGKTDLNTQSYVGELSYAFLTNDDKTLVRPYAAVRYTRIKQDGYSERTTSAVTAPLTYAALSDRSTAALVGVKLNHKLTDKVNLTGSLGVEQDINHDVDNLTASGVSGLTSEAFNNNINRTRPVASVGAYYMPVKNQRIAADIYYQELPFQSTAATTAYVNYMIGF